MLQETENATTTAQRPTDESNSAAQNQRKDADAVRQSVIPERAAEMKRVSKRRPCPVCGKPDWCLVAADNSAAICARVEEGSKKRCGEAGWLHILRPASRPQGRRIPKRLVPVCSKPTQDFRVLAQRCRHDITPARLEGLAESLNVTAESLRRLWVGWNGAGHTFPMCDEAGKVIGLRVRYPSGFKAAETGSSNGLFVPEGLPPEGPLLICEGPTDTAAALDFGFAAVGRASCNSGSAMLANLTRGRDVVIVGDGDAPGRRGAERLASILVLGCTSVRIIYPPAGIKDLRQWKTGGLSQQELQAAIERSKPALLKVKAKVNARTRKVNRNG